MGGSKNRKQCVCVGGGGVVEFCFLLRERKRRREKKVERRLRNLAEGRRNGRKTWFFLFVWGFFVFVFVF